MDHEELAKRIGTIQTGESVTSADVQAELRSKSYVSHNGQLSPSEFDRLKVYAKRRAIARCVDAAFVADAKAKPVVARKPLAMARATDPLYDPTIQARFKVLAWAGYRAGPVR